MQDRTMQSVDAVVIGAGVVGLAVARAMAQRGLETILLEAALGIGTGTSSRNSEVLHAGLYYPPGSLKARLCVRGRRLLYEYCAARGLPHARCGKFVVATQPGQEAALQQLLQQGQANGVEELALLSARQAHQAEPALQCTAVLESRSTGIVDSHALMLALQGDFEAAGGALAFGAPVLAGSRCTQGIRLDVGGPEPMSLAAGIVVNAAGLHAPQLAARFEGLAPGSVPAAHYAKGSYFSLGGRSPFARLIYPVPEPGGLGVHLTLDLGGQARFGPDVQWLDGLGDPRGPGPAGLAVPAQLYEVDPARAAHFYAAIRRYWPALPDGALQPAYAGIRPKVSGPGEPAADFRVQDARSHGLPGLVNLFGIESPGLTACLALAEEVSARL
jgi:L-2-hydroxyglutarate oxidase LhgO